jgi:lipopolysaccharide/colanic/teichoic acid biosynthesis glycosyltransferase
MNRYFDILFSTMGLIIFSPIFLILWVAGLFDTGSPIFRQVRVGRNKHPFTLFKFRTMRPDAPSIATHLANPISITRFGRFLRGSKIDELPQLWNVLKGDMSLVGPRPCLLSQGELIQARERLGVFDARPGITGLAQINKIDMSTPDLLAKTDASMVSSFTLIKYFYYIFMTLRGKGSGDRIINK